VKVRLPESDKEVNVPAAGVVAPTVPLILIEAVPVRLVTTPLAGVPKAGVVRVGLVKVLFVSVSVPARETKSASVTAVLNCANVPDTVLLPRAMVLFVSVSVVALPTKVSVEVGSVRVPVLVIELITGVVRVLLVSVCESEVPTTVPDGAVLVAQVSKSASHACTLVPIATPRLVLAVVVLFKSDKLFVAINAPDNEA